MLSDIVSNRTVFHTAAPYGATLLGMSFVGSAIASANVANSILSVAGAALALVGMYGFVAIAALAIYSSSSYEFTSKVDKWFAIATGFAVLHFFCSFTPIPRTYYIT